MGVLAEEEAQDQDAIRQRIDALLIAYQYAPEIEKQNIKQRIDALQIALEYAAA